MGALLGRLIATHRSDRTTANGVPVGYLGHLVRGFEADSRHTETGVGASSSAVPGLVTGLSERELEVLRLMGAGKQNREIASELYVALDTVKKHVTHILGKLGASNRTEATTRARELGLLP
jgi:LuxR family maltose regulon positive regulatory protein